ncbi:MAG: helix-turn-helix domain-containing protein [Desulfosporosinus sp.]|nr:helix-turn-helix domain-containing protein [Desulfosporosinus sp.]
MNMNQAAKAISDPKMIAKNISNWDELPLFLTVEQTAQLMQCGTAHIYNLARTKDFPARRMTKTIVISRDGLRQWAEGDEKWKQSITIWQWQNILQQMQRMGEVLERIEKGRNLYTGT